MFLGLNSSVGPLVPSTCTRKRRHSKDSLAAQGHQLAVADTSTETQSISLTPALLTSSHFGGGGGGVIVIGMNGLSGLIMGIVNGPEWGKKKKKGLMGMH